MSCNRKFNMADLEARRSRERNKKEFDQRVAIIRGTNALKELWNRVAADDPTVLELRLAADPELSREMSVWLPERQAAAVRLLCHQELVTRLELSGLALKDNVAFGLADVLRSKSALMVSHMSWL